jgi:hypothetical protein
VKGDFFTILVEIEVARAEDLLGSTLHVDTSIVAIISLPVVLSDCRHSLSL